MSHFSISKIKLKNPNIDLLKAVVQEIAKEMNAQIVSSIRMWGGKEYTDFDIALKSDHMPYGVGIKVNKNGEVELRGDLGMITASDKLKLEQELTKMYTSTAVAKVLQRMGYSVQAQKTQEKVIINARN